MQIDIRNNARGTIHVHKAHCGDLRQSKYAQLVRTGSVWTVEAASICDIVLDVYDPDDFEYDPADWRDYLGDLHIYPCVDLPEEDSTT
jgi:hypothetical protein